MPFAVPYRPARRRKMKKGFTLIELLVVVLIIGILSAVALPQYTIAVEKSRMAEANVILKSLTDACSVYYMANNGEDDYCRWDNIDIDLNMPEADGEGEDALARQGKYFFYSLETPNANVFACRGNFNSDYEFEYCLNYFFEADKRPGNVTRECEGRTAKGKRICKATCGAETCNY